MLQHEYHDSLILTADLWQFSVVNVHNGKKSASWQLDAGVTKISLNGKGQILDTGIIQNFLWNDSPDVHTFESYPAKWLQRIVKFPATQLQSLKKAN